MAWSPLASPNFFSWALLVPIIIWTGNKFRFSKGDWAAPIPAYIILSFLLIPFHTLFTIWISPLIKPAIPGAKSGLGDVFNQTLILERLPVDILIYWAVVGVIYAGEYYARFNEHERAARELETQVTSAQLQALKMQINPHFFLTRFKQSTY